MWSELVLRQGRYGMFIGCSAYPKCHHIESQDNLQMKPNQANYICPECGEGHLAERKTRFW